MVYRKIETLELEIEQLQGTSSFQLAISKKLLCT